MAVGIGLRVRAVRAGSRATAVEMTPPETADAPPIPTARQWLARENAMNVTNELPPLRDPAGEPEAASAAPQPEAGVPPVTVAPSPPLSAAVATIPPPSYDNRPIDDAIVFPTGRGFGDYRTVDLPPPRNAVDLPEAGTIASILSEGLDDLATGGDRLAEAVRERPIQYVLGALAAGFAAGLMFPMVYGQQRVAKLLERLIESNEEIKRVRIEDRRDLRAEIERRESERFRQSRPS